MTKRIRIAVDARPLEGRLTGIGQYTFHLLRELVALEQYDWFLLSNYPLTQFAFLHNSNVHSISFEMKFPKAGTFLSQTKFPFWCRKNSIDLFWSPRHHLPLILPSQVIQIVTVHDVVWKKVPETMKWGRRFLEALLMPRSLKKANHIIVDSHSTKNDLIEIFNLKSDKLDVVPLGATVKNIQHVDYADKPYILFIGTLEPRKNLRRLLSAYKLLGLGLREKYDFMIIGGKGWGEGDILELGHELRISAHIKIKGYVQHDDMTRLLANAAMLAMPSLYEGFGLPLLDAMTLGVPVMTSNNSSMPEVTGTAAMLVDPYSMDSMKEAMERLLTDDWLRDELINKGKEQAKHFSWQKAAEKTDKIFTKAIESALLSDSSFL